MTNGPKVTRRQTVKAAAAAAALPWVHIRSGRAAGRLSLSFWEHWVPAGNDKLRELVTGWARRNQLEVQLDLYSSLGGRHVQQVRREATERSGHDVITLPTWEVQNNLNLLESMDDVMRRTIRRNGVPTEIATFLAKDDASWRAVPAISGSQNKPCCSRIDLFKQHVGMDPTVVFPPRFEIGPGYAQWTWDAFLTAAEKCKAAGVPFGLPLSDATDAIDWTAALFASYGAVLVDWAGRIRVRSDAVRQVLDYAKRLVPHLPPDVFTWDNASNNRALVTGRSALIMNPPSAWVEAKAEAPQVAAQCWTHPLPAGPRGRATPHQPFFWGVWSFSRNKTAAKDLLEWLSEREQAQQMVVASNGYDIPPYPSMGEFEVWEKEGPPAGTIFNYPMLFHHGARATIPGYPAPSHIAAKIYEGATMNKMIQRATQGGESIEDVITWAIRELESFRR